MRLANNIKVSIFVKPEDDMDKIRTKLLSLFPFTLEDEKIALKQSKVSGFNQRKIEILEVDIEKERHTNVFLNHLRQELSEQQKSIIIKQENRLDDECNFFIRLDKQKLLNGEFWITESGDCFHIKINIAAFPKKKEKAKKVIEKIFF